MCLPECRALQVRLGVWQSEKVKSADRQKNKQKCVILICIEEVRPPKSPARRALRSAQRRSLLNVLPAAGNRNCNGNVNNVGSNGNYWSSTPNGSENAWNLNFNSGEVNMNNNNRCNGQSVRLVQAFTKMDTLLTDLFKAYYDARRNKRNTPSQLRFEMDLETNLIDLYHELHDRRYCPSPSVCFVVQDSVKREVFASQFRDRVVHHLYYNYVSPFFERQFIYDSYSCRKGKGTLLGIERLEHHIRSVSHNYTHKAYILKMDIKGYFMSINRKKLCRMVHEMMDKGSLPEENKGIVNYLTDIITMKDALQGAKIRGSRSDWADLPPTKCLSCSPKGVGMPIGDLTSQLFSNVFLNKLDWFVTMELGFKHYGRYVDDFYIVDADKQRLKNAKKEISRMLTSLGLELHPRKVRLHPVTQSVGFLGAVVHPYFRSCSSRTMHKYLKYKSIYLTLLEKTTAITDFDTHRCLSSMNSYIGYLGHFKAVRQVADICESRFLLFSVILPSLTSAIDF